MNRIKFIDRMARGRVDRRDMVRAAAAFGVGVAACAPIVRTRGQITVFEWSGYDIPELMPGYAEKHGGPPEFAIFASEEEAFQKIRTGFKGDVMHPCTYSVYQFKDGGMTVPVDTSKLSHWPDVIPALRTAGGVVIDGGVHMVPTDWGNSSVIYRTDMVDEAFQKDESWGILFDETYAGKIAPSDGESNVEIAGLLIGLGPDEIFRMTDAQLEQVRPLLEKQATIARFYWSDPTEFGQAMAGGEIVRRVRLERGGQEPQRTGDSGQVRGAQGGHLHLAVRLERAQHRRGRPGSGPRFHRRLARARGRQVPDRILRLRPQQQEGVRDRRARGDRGARLPGRPEPDARRLHPVPAVAGRAQRQIHQPVQRREGQRGDLKSARLARALPRDIVSVCPHGSTGSA